MKKNIMLLALGCLLLSGCAIIQLPFKIVGGTFDVLGSVAKGVFGLLEKLPTPPPGVIPGAF